MSFVVGDVLVHQLSISGADFSRNFISFDVYESIYTPGIVAHINLLDTEDALQRLRLSGGEPVVIVFQSPGGFVGEYTLVVNKISNISSTISNYAKSYTVEAVSLAVLSAKSQYVVKKYNFRQYSSMVQDVFGYLSSTKGLIDIETTRGMHKYAVQNEKPFAAIDQLRRRSVSATNNSSSYLFFENRDGFHFVTLEELFRRNNIVKNIYQRAGVGGDFFNAPADNIVGYVARQQMNAGQVITSGGQGGLYGVFNMFTMEYAEKAINDTLGGLTAGGNISSLLSHLGGGSGKPGLKNFLAASNETETGLGGKSHIPEAAPHQMAYAGAVSSTAASISTIGDAVFTAGKSVRAEIFQKADTTTGKSLEYGLSDVFLIANVRHQIKPPGVRPRYLTVLECVKGALEEGG